METEIKYLSGQVREFGENVEDTRTVEFVISTSGKDRHNSIINSATWDLENYNRNPIVGYQHNVYGGGMCLKADPDDIIGTSQVRTEGENLIGAVTFEPPEENALAEKIFRKVLRGTMRSASVGFLPKLDKKGKSGKWGSEEDGEDRNGENPTYRYNDGQELIEWSIVNIPSNPKAQAKALRSEVANALIFLKHELGFSFADIENLRVKDAVEMIENPDKREIKHIPELINDLVNEALGDKFSDEEIEKLTIKGLFNILRGEDAAEVEEADTGEKVDTEAREKRIKQKEAINNYLNKQKNYDTEREIRA